MARTSGRTLDAKSERLRLHNMHERVGLSGELPRAGSRKKIADECGAADCRETSQSTFPDGDGTMTKLLTLLVAATLTATAAGCGCCGWCWPKAPAAPVCATPAPACPPPVAADPCSVPTSTTYGYAPATGW